MFPEDNLKVSMHSVHHLVYVNTGINPYVVAPLNDENENSYQRTTHCSV